MFKFLISPDNTLKHFISTILQIQNIATGTAAIMDQSLRMIMLNRTRFLEKVMNNTNSTDQTMMPITPQNLWEPHYEPGDTFIKERVTQSSAESDSEVQETKTKPVLYKARTQSPFSYLGKEAPHKGLIPEAYYEITKSTFSDGPKLGKESTTTVLTDSLSDSDRPKTTQEEAEIHRKVQPDMSHSEKPNTRPEFSIEEIHKNVQPDLSVPSPQVNVEYRAQPKSSDPEKPKLRKDFTTPVVNINRPALDSVEPNFRKNEVPTPEPVSQNEPPKKINNFEPRGRGCHPIPKNVVENKQKPLTKLKQKINETKFSKISKKIKKHLDSWAFKVHNFYKA